MITKEQTKLINEVYKDIRHALYNYDNTYQVDEILKITKQEEKSEDKNYYRREIRYGSFSRMIPLPAAVKADEADAKMKDGMVEITIPKSETA